MEHEIIILIVPILALVGGICIGILYTRCQVTLWRQRWIELEHETAKELDREPRNIDAYGSKYNKPKAPIFEDITERKKTEKQTKKKTEQLERFAKLAVGREDKMIELKKRILELDKKLKQKKGNRK